MSTNKGERGGGGGKHLALYEDDDDDRPFVSRIINRLANYDGGVVPSVEQEPCASADELDVPDEAIAADGGPDGAGGKKKKKKTVLKIKGAAKKKPQKLGTVLGVYFPCIQNIFGVILFIRLVWVVGTAGWVEAFVIAFMCCCCTMTTSISMSAIATNGVVPGGGSYFMISRSLGPEFGGAVGILFYLGTTVASSMYIIGAVEILLQYMAPAEAALFGPINIPSNAYNSYRVYGTCLLILMFICVFIGVKFVSKFSPIALFCVVCSIVCVYIGIFMSNPGRGPTICFLGERLLARAKITDANGDVQCNKFTNESGLIYKMMCNTSEPETDPSCRFFNNESNIADERAGIPGLNSGMFYKNAFNRYNRDEMRIGEQEYGDRTKGDILADMSTSFIVLIGIFFPSVTGIMAGSNRSGDLADAQRSIPVGTIGAVATTSIVYLSCLLLFGACVEGQFLRDKIGESMGGGLIVAQMAWPTPWVIMIGSFLSTCGAGLQSLVGAPRLLQAIAADGVIPFLNVFAVTNAKGEPRRALFLTAAIAECGVVLANVDYIAPIITMFFLMCYCFTNLACAVQTILKSPNWRPRFKLYHWSLSLFGVGLCLALMFMASWYYTIVALGIAAGIYKYIEYKGAEKEWGDGIRGLAMSAARYALLRLEEGEPHVKNWRPQLLILLKTGENLEPKYRKLLTFSSQLKAGKGLTIVAAVLEGEHRDRRADAEIVRHKIYELMKREKVKGFTEVIIGRNVGDSIGYLLQGAGVGGLRHNAVLMNWPHKWRQDNRGYRNFLESMRMINERQLALMILKGITQFPENGDRLGGTIDIWWIVHDGGLLMLLPFLLTQCKVWKKCKMRIFTIAQMEDNTIQIQKDLETFLYHLRIPAEVKVVEMMDKDIAAYTYERTLVMEQRTAILENLKLPRKSITAQMIMLDQNRSHHHPSTQAHSNMYQTIHEDSSCPPTSSTSHAASRSPPLGSSPGVSPPSYLNIMQTAKPASRDIDVEKGDVSNQLPPPPPSPSHDNHRNNVEDDGHYNAKNSPNKVMNGVGCMDGEGDESAIGAGGGVMNEACSTANGSDAEKLSMGGASTADLDALSRETKHSEGTGTEAGTTVGGGSPGKTASGSDGCAQKTGSKRESQNLRRMHTAVSLNRVMHEHSIDAKLVIMNLPGPPKDLSGEENYMDFLDALTDGLQRVMMVRGGGREVITIFS